MLCMLTAILTGVVLAQDVSVRSDHPDRYVVVKGDTLWDISGRFLDQPWQWPAIWHANPHIENPHLIYPGDELSLVYVDGVPQLRLNREGTEKLSPAIRVVDRGAPINAIPLDRLAPFLRDVRVLSPSEFEGLPYIVANEVDRLTATYSDQTYARNLNARVGDEFVVARLYSIYDQTKNDGIRRVLPRRNWQQAPNMKNPNETLWNDTAPWDKRARNPVGYELVEVSRVRVNQQSGNISVLDILRDRTEVKEGDYILPLDSRSYDDPFQPHAMDRVPDGLRILSTKDALYGVGHFQIVALNGGSNQGLESGHVFSVFRPGRTVDDRVGFRWGSFDEKSEVELPDQFHALVMVFRTFGDISYAMVLDGDNLVRAFDELRHPSERS
jgi:hypothetical protein